MSDCVAGGASRNPAGIKYDDGKLRYDLIDPYFEEGLAKVLTHGASEYGPNKWQGVERERYIAALRRHLSEILKGEPVDSKSGLFHWDHIAANVMFLRFLDIGRYL